MAAGERSPIEGVVDIDSFAVWVQEYIATSRSDPTVEKFSTNNLPEEDELIGWEDLNIYNFPWENLPTSLQEILVMQFESAKRAGTTKLVYSIVRDDRFVLELRSNEVAGLAGGIFDRYAETYSVHGVTLDFENTALLSIFPSTKGVWQISRIPMSQHMQFRHLLGEDRHRELISEEVRTHLLERYIHTLNQSDILIPATVDQLRDCARFLELATPYRRIAVLTARE